MFQAGQDVVVDPFLKQKTGGTFLDVGAMTALPALTLCFLKNGAVGQVLWSNR